MKASRKPTSQHQKAALPEPLVEREAERLGEPVGVAGKDREHDTRDDHVMEVRDQEQAVVDDEVDRRDREQDTGQAAGDEGQHEPIDQVHRHGEANPAAVHREQPVVDLHAGRDARSACWRFRTRR